MNEKLMWSGKIRIITAAVFIITAIFQVGCSRSSDPLVPSVIPQPGENQPLHEGSSYIIAFGLIDVDPDSETVELVPARASEVHLNIRKFVEEMPCVSCFKLVSASFLPNGDIDVGLQLTHPFPGLDQFTCFDPRCILMFNGSENWPGLNAVVPRSELGDGELVNADGYTRLYNPVEFPPFSMAARFWEYSQGKMSPSAVLSSTLNGYKNFPVDNSRRYLGSTASSTVEFVINPPDGAFQFGYAVDVSWEAADPAFSGNPTVIDVPDDFPMIANMPEAYMLSTSMSGELYNLSTGMAEIVVDVYDWQENGDNANVQVECPDVFNGILDLEYDSDGPDYARFTGEVKNENAAPIGEYDFLVAVWDEINGTSPLPAIAYSFGNLEVTEQQEEYFDPVAVAGAYPLSTTADENIFFYDNGSFDPDGGDILVYEWDFDGDGFYDQEGTEIDYIYNTPGTYNVQFRVTDDEGAMDTLDEPIIIEILGTPPQLVTVLEEFHSPYCVKIDKVQNACYVDCTEAAPVLDFGFYKIDENEVVTKEFEKSGYMFSGMPGMFGLNEEARKIIAPDILGMWPTGGPVDIWDLSGGDPLKFYIPVEEADQVAFLWDGEFFDETNQAVIAEGLTNNLIVWDIDETSPVYEFYPTNGFPQYLEADYDNHRLFLYCTGSGTEAPSVMVFDSDSWANINTIDTDIPTAPFMSDLDYDLDLNRIYFGSGADSFEVWDTTTYTLVETVNCGYGEVRGIDHMLGNIYVAVLQGAGGRLLVYNAETLGLKWDIPTVANAGLLACNSNYGKIYIASMDGQVVMVYQD
jgi:PKD repeat protein